MASATPVDEGDSTNSDGDRTVGKLKIEEPAEIIITIFIVFYLVAQAVELITGLFKKHVLHVRDAEINIQKMASEEAAKKAAEKIVNVAAGEIDENAENEIIALEKIVKDYQRANSRYKLHLGLFATALGILACASLKIGFLENIIGYTHFKPIVWGVTPDHLFTGVVVGGGTRPLHDLLKYVEKKKG
jgi:hypothetical protein